MSRGAARDALRALLAGGGNSGVPAAASHWRAEAARLAGAADPPVVAQAEELARRAPSPPPPETRGEGGAVTPPDEPLAPSSGDAPVADVAVDALIGTVEMLVAEGEPALALKALERLQTAAYARRAFGGRVAPLGAASRAPMLRCARALAALVGGEDAAVAAAAAHAFFALCQVSTSPVPRALLAAALVALPPERQELACTGCLERVDADELVSLRGAMLNLLKGGADWEAAVDWETGDVGLNKTLHIFLPVVLVTNPACRVEPCETLFASLATVIEAMLAAGQPPPQNSAALAIALILLRFNAGAVGEPSFASARPALVDALRSSGVAPRLRAALASIVASCAGCDTAMAALAGRTLADFANVFDVPAAERAEQLRAAMPAPLLVAALAASRPDSVDAAPKQKLRDAEAALRDAGRAAALAAALTPSADASLALLSPALELLEDAAALLAPPPTQPESVAGGQEAPCTVPLHRGPDAPLLSAAEARATWARLAANGNLSMATAPLPALLPSSESEVAQRWGWSSTIASSDVIFDPPGADGARLGMRKAAGTRGYSSAFGCARLWRGAHRWEVRLVNAGDRACVGVAAGPEPVAAARAGAWLCGSRNAWVLVSGGPGQPARGAYADGRREAGVTARLGAGALVAVSYDADAGTLRFAIDGTAVEGLTLRNVPRGARPVVCLDGAGEGAQLVGRWRVMPAETRQLSPDAQPAPLNAAVTLVCRAMLMLLGWLRAAEAGRIEAAARPDADSSSEACEEDPAVHRGADAALVAPPVLLRVLRALAAVMDGMEHDAAPSKSGALYALLQLLPSACALARAVASTPTADVAGLPLLLERIAVASRALELRCCAPVGAPGSAGALRAATALANSRAALSAAAGVLVGRAQREWPPAADSPLSSAVFAGGMRVAVDGAIETAVDGAPPASSGAAVLSPALASAERAAYAAVLHASADGGAALAESRRVADELLRRARAEAQPDASPAPAAYATAAAAVRRRSGFLMSCAPSVAAASGAAAAAAAARVFLLDGPDATACIAAVEAATSAAVRYADAHAAAASLLGQLGWADQRTSAPLLTSMLAERAGASLEVRRAPGAGGASAGFAQLAATAEAVLLGALLRHADMMVPSAPMAAAALVVPFSAHAVAGDVADTVADKLARCTADGLSRSPPLAAAPPPGDGPAEPGVAWPLAALCAALLRAAVAVEAAPAGDEAAAATASTALAAALEAACLPLAALLGQCISATGPHSLTAPTFAAAVAGVPVHSEAAQAGRARRSRQLAMLLRSVSTALAAAPHTARAALAKTHGVLVRIAASAAPTPAARAAAAEALARALAAGSAELDFALFVGLLDAAVAASPDTVLFQVLTPKAGAPLRQPQPAPSLPLRRALLGALRASPAATSRALQRDDGLHSRNITLLIGLPPGIAGIAPIAKDITTEAATRVLTLLAVVGGASDAELPCALPQEGPLRALIAGAGPQLLPLLADAVPPDEWDDPLRLGDRLLRVTLAARCAKALWEALRRDDDDAMRLAASLQAEPDEDEEEDPPPTWRALLKLAARAPVAKLAGVSVEQLAASAALYSHRLVSDAAGVAALASAPPRSLNDLAASLHEPPPEEQAVADVAVPEKLGRLLWRTPEAPPLLPRRGAPVPPPEVLRRQALDAAAKATPSDEPHVALAAAEMAAAVLYARMALLRALALAPPAQHVPLSAGEAFHVAAVLRACLLPERGEQRWARRTDGLPAARAFTRGGGADADEDVDDTAAATALLAALRACAGPALADAVAAQLRALPAALAPAWEALPSGRFGSWGMESVALETPPVAAATVALAAALLPLLPAGELPARRLSVALGNAVLEPLLPPQARAAAIEALLAERGALPADAPLTGGLTALLPARHDVAIVAASQLLLEPAAPCLSNRTILRFSAAALQRAGIALPALEHLERRRRTPAFASPLAAAMTELHLAISSAGGGGIEHIEPRLPDRPLLAFERLHELGCALDAGTAMPEWAERELTRLLATQPAPVASGGHGEFRRAASGADVRLSGDRRRMWVVSGDNDDAGADEAPLPGTHDADEVAQIGLSALAAPPANDDAYEPAFGYTTDERVSALLGPPGGMARGSGVHSIEFIVLAGEEMSVGLACGIAAGDEPAYDGQLLRTVRLPDGRSAEWLYALHAWGDENGHSYDDADSDDGWEGPASLLDCDDAAFQAAADEAAALSGWDIDPFDPCGGASGGAETTRCLEFFSAGDTVRLSLDTGDAEDAASPRMPSLTVYVNGLRAGPRVAGLAFPLYFAVGGTGGTELAIASATTRPPYSKDAYKETQDQAAQWAKEPPRPVAVRQPGPAWAYPADDAALVAWLAATASAQRGCTGASSLTPGDVFDLARKAVCGAAGSVPLPPSLDPFFGPDSRALMARFTTLWLYNALAAPLLPLLGLGAAPAARTLAADVARRATLLFPVRLRYGARGRMRFC